MTHSGIRTLVVTYVIACLVSLALPSSAVLADTEDAPKVWVLSSQSGKHFLVMHPEGKTTGGQAREPIAVCYSVDGVGEFHEKWRAHGWYMSGGALSADGVHLVRFGGWPSDFDKLSDLALAIYKNGEELARYSVSDLVRDKNRLDRLASHYRWRAARRTYEDGFISGGEYFVVTLADGGRYTFSMETGEIDSVEHDAYAAPRSLVIEEVSRSEQGIVGYRPVEMAPNRGASGGVE